ncbi:MAG: 30S ribosomal protein S12 methylthiotransferase RimO [Clostridiales bacterium]|nr:30S ribosomal protein S12 methylthiotransferase RimO [Clostridiales bacterium]
MTLEEFKNKKIGFIALGCDKNRVDLEKMIYKCKAYGLKIVNDPSLANIIIVNTCSFLESARLESIENIIEMSSYKGNNLEKLVVTGCLNELGYADLDSSLPEVDKFVRISDNGNIVKILAQLYGLDIENELAEGRVLTTANHYGYLKIADGCNNFCSYCLIPYIRGRNKSVDIDILYNEAVDLSNKGVKELILVAQDVTKYGLDLYGKRSIVDLLRKLSTIDTIDGIRLLYCYPEEMSDELIEEIATNPKIIKYLDIPLQHVSDSVLKNMNRRSTKASIFELFNKLQTKIPDIVLRTTFILGFPGETNENIEEIKEFLLKFKLQNVGFFTYSREEGTRAYNFDNQIEESIKQERLQYLSQVQYEIQLEYNDSLIGKVLDVVVDYVDGNTSCCRYYGQAPLIDSVVYVNEPLEIGKNYKIKITNKSDYDLEGERYEFTK